MIEKIKLSKEAWLRMRGERIKRIIDSHLEKIKFLRNSSDDVIDSQWFYVDEDYINSFKSYEQHVGKYMKIDFLRKTFEKGLFFQEPSQWNDDFESRFYTADYTKILTADKIVEVTPRLYAICFTYGFETEAAWKTYIDAENSSTNVVRLEINRRKLLYELNEWAQMYNYTAYAGYANYTYPLHLLKTIHTASEREHALWFEDFSLNNYLSLLLQKRQAYYNEMEERIFLIPDDKSIPIEKNLCVKLPLEKIVDKIILCPDFQAEKEKEIYDLCSEFKINCKIQRSELNAKKSNIDSQITIEKISDNNPWKFSDLR